jgi:hypothetical protein
LIANDGFAEAAPAQPSPTNAATATRRLVRAMTDRCDDMMELPDLEVTQRFPC